MEEQNSQTLNDQSMKNSKVPLVGILAASLLLILIISFFFMSQKKRKSDTGSTTNPTLQVPATPGSGVEETVVNGNENNEVKEVLVEGQEYSYSPSAIAVKKGEKVLLTFKNTGKLAHNLTIDSLGVTTRTIPGGQSDSVEFTAGESGTFSFFCSIGNHKSMGMEGEMKVE